MANQSHEKWIKWLGIMDTYMKHDVSLYQLKYIYERTLVDPRTTDEQEGMADGLGLFDLLLVYVYEYDGGVIGAGGHHEVIEDTMTSESDEFYNGVNNIILQKGGIRIGLYTCRKGFHPTFHMISTYEEDSTYYVKDTKGLYDDITNELYYRIRYGISSETYYVLSGMSEWKDDIFREIVAPPCPYEHDKMDEQRYCMEYIQGADLEPIKAELYFINIDDYKSVSKMEEKYGLTFRMSRFIKEDL